MDLGQVGMSGDVEISVAEPCCLVLVTEKEKLIESKDNFKYRRATVSSGYPIRDV